ncbi:MAG: PD-(D/E)XK nuclease family protein [Acidobacteriota bacterium]
MKLSASRLATFHQCRLKYHYAYHIKLPRPNVNPRTQLGIIVHKALEIFYREFHYQPLVLPTIEWLREAYERAWQEHGKEISGEEYDKLWQAGWQGLNSYYQRHISTDGGKTGRFEPPFLVEQRFRARVLVAGNWITLTGRVDRLDWLDYSQATLRLIEYKTTKKTPNDKQEIGFPIQLGFYQWAIQEVYGYGLREVSYHYVLAGKEYTYECKPAHRQMIERIAGLVVENEELDEVEDSWQAQVGAHCTNCEFRRYCAAANPQAERPPLRRIPKQLKLF